MPHNLLFFVLISAVHYFLSTRASVYWGAIIPVACLASFGWIFTAYQVDHPIKLILLFLFGLSILLVEWEKGRKIVKKKQQNELNKMKTQDI
ncbi:hypothetical protein ACLZHR_08645 [Priestia aryabhattai]|uniref:hypothetical protein n=1 Tax=Priestia TaxID=2800373 RepID=UPI001C8D758B|nr:MULTISPECIES: hypothetical protein [Priestia]MBY0064321.1 hypothetical protein [Priestia aryabhattai]MCL9635978.1 hypothetical protein [Bacillus zanthoxyli]MCZ8495505.1 hypothetical protein [Priestia megaterium]WKU25214.1 hypothetical protein Q3A90_10245 [Priestia megaterium]